MLAGRTSIPERQAVLSRLNAAVLAGMLALAAMPGLAAGQEQAAAPQAAPLSPLPAPLRITRQVAPGVRHTQFVRESRERPLAAHLLRADPKQPGWRLEVRPAKDILLTSDNTKGREAVCKLAVRRGALAALNGGFFGGTGDPLGLQITDGELLSEPYPGRSGFGITRDGRTLWGPTRFVATAKVGDRSFPIKGVNRPRGTDEMVVFTPRYAESTGANPYGAEVVVEWLNGPLRAGTRVEGTVSDTRAGQGNARIPADGLVLSGHGAAATFLKAVNTGDAVRVEIRLVGEAGESWDEAWQAIGAGPRLLKKGVVCVGPGAEGFRSDVLQGRAPRSAVAMTRDGELLLAAVDGRQMVSGGLTLVELAEWLRDEGAVEAVNLDGGGSTTLALRQLVVNQPSQGTQRLVANALVIALDQQAPAEEGELALLAPEGMAAVDGAVPMPAGTRVRFRAARRLPDGTWQDLPEDAVTWSLEGQVGLLTQDGALLPMRAGPGAVVFSTGKQIARAPLVAVAGPPATVTCAFEASAAAEEPPTVRARVVDAYGNPVTDAEVTLAYTTAEGARTAVLATDARGEARLPLPVALLKPGTPVTVAAATLPAVPVKLPAPAPVAADGGGKTPAAPAAGLAAGAGKTQAPKTPAAPAPAPADGAGETTETGTGDAE